jgi:hypothetical protein
MTTGLRAALGFRHHTGWTIIVALAGEPTSPVLLDRQRIELVGSDIPVEVYHAASNFPPPEAERLVEQARSAAHQAAAREVRTAVAELETSGYTVVAAGLAAEVRRLPPLERILPVHILRHSAEGEMYRSAIASAADAAGLRVLNISPKEIDATATSVLGLGDADLRALLDGLGRSVGPPWRQDHRHAALAAMIALAARE